jgi:hypothetical protein
MTLTAMRPEIGLSKGREVSLWSDARLENDGKDQCNDHAGEQDLGSHFSSQFNCQMLEMVCFATG